MSNLVEEKESILEKWDRDHLKQYLGRRLKEQKLNGPIHNLLVTGLKVHVPLLASSPIQILCYCNVYYTTSKWETPKDMTYSIEWDSVYEYMMEYTRNEKINNLLNIIL